MVTLLFLLNFYSETLTYRPGSVHQWRQADCLSITKNYYEEGMHFLQPKVHSNRAPHNKAVSEFPILNYTVATLWKVFGEHEFIYRLLEYLIYLVAVFILFNTLLRFFHLKLPVFFLVSLILTSPLLTYYSFNFLSDVPALSFCIISFCCLFTFYKTKATAYFYVALALATLAVLLKASALTALVCIGFFCIIDLFRVSRWLGIQPSFKQAWIPLLFVALAAFLIDAWYTFALHYNTFDNGFFLLTTLPIWDMTKGEIYETQQYLFTSLLPSFLNKPMLALFFSMILFVFFHFKKLDAFLRYCFLFALLFFVAYILFFFRVFNVHDYYLVNLFILPVITFFCVADILSKLLASLPSFAKVILPVLFLFNSLDAAAFYRLRMIKDDNLCEWYPFISPVEKKSFEYMIWEYEETKHPLENLQPDLRRLGLNRNDSVLCIVDDSPNVALYFMDQKGYSFSKDQFLKDSLCLQKLMPRHIPYIVVTDSNLTYEKAFQIVPGSYEPVFTRSRIKIFKLKK